MYQKSGKFRETARDQKFVFPDQTTDHLRVIVSLAGQTLYCKPDSKLYIRSVRGKVFEEKLGPWLDIGHVYLLGLSYHFRKSALFPDMRTRSVCGFFLTWVGSYENHCFDQCAHFHISGWIYLIMGEQRMNAEHARIAKHLRDERMRVIYVRK